MRKTVFGLTILLLAFWLSSAAQGSFITGSSATAAGGSVNLTTQGTADWAKYSTAPGNSNFDHKLGGGSAISTSTGDNSNYGGNTGSNPTFTWSDGTPTLNGTTPSGVTSTAGLTTPLAFTVVGNGLPEELIVYFGNYQTNATLTATLPGATSYTDTYNSSNALVVLTRAYTLDFQAANPGDLLTVSLKRISNVNGSSTLVLFAATLTTATTAVPEPTSGALMLVGMASIWLLRRRRA